MLFWVCNAISLFVNFPDAASSSTYSFNANAQSGLSQYGTVDTNHPLVARPTTNNQQGTGFNNQFGPTNANTNPDIEGSTSTDNDQHGYSHNGESDLR